MSRCRVLAMSILVVLTALASPAVAAETTEPRADAAVQVTATPAATRAHAVPAIATHPDDPRAIAVAEGDAYAGRCSLHVSTDAGLTWTARPLPEVAEWPQCNMFASFGPVAGVAFADDGTLYVARSGIDPSTYHQRVLLDRTTDLGESFETTVLPWVEPDLDAGQFGADALPTVVVDRDQPGRVYVGWMSNNGTWNLSADLLEGQEYYWDIKSRPYVSVSQDGGRTFSAPVDVAGDLDGWFSEPHLTVGADGALHAFFGQNVRPPKDSPEGTLAPPASLWLATSHDGGRSFEQQAIHTRPAKERDWLSGASPAVDPATGALYVAWEETGEGEPMVAFMRSDDGGATWSQPVRVNDAEPQREWSYNEFFPSLAVAPNGRLDVAWYDWRNDVAFDPEADENRWQDVYYSYSTDGGRTWAANIKVTDRAIDRSLGVAKTYGVKGPIGLAATDQAAYVAWDDTRNSNEDTSSQDVYFSRVRFADPQQLFSTVGAGADTRALWGGLGAGAALAVGGLVLLVGTRAARREPRTPRPGAEPAVR